MRRDQYMNNPAGRLSCASAAFTSTLRGCSVLKVTAREIQVLNGMNKNKRQNTLLSYVPALMPQLFVAAGDWQQKLLRE